MMVPGLSVLAAFMHRGGPMLWGLAGLLFCFSLLLMERWLYLLRIWPGYQRQILKHWTALDSVSLVSLQQWRCYWLAEAEMCLKRYLGLTRALIRLCPLMGLLGTVTGMIQLFDGLAMGLAMDGSWMAAGIARATLPTLAGMVAALFGLLNQNRLEQQIRTRLAGLEDAMVRRSHS